MPSSLFHSPRPTLTGRCFSFGPPCRPSATATSRKNFGSGLAYSGNTVLPGGGPCIAIGGSWTL